MRTLDEVRTQPPPTDQHDEQHRTEPPRPRHTWWWATGGASLGLAAGVGAYLLVDPWLEGVGPPLEDLQGLASNVVPLGGLLGTWVGVWLSGRGRDA